MRFFFEGTADVSDEELRRSADALQEYRNFLQHVASRGGYEESESAINLPFDSRIIERARTSTFDKRRNGLKYVIVIGIGGSNLGAKAVYDALYGYFDALEPSRYPRMLFFDTNNGAYIHRALALLSRTVSGPQKVVVNVITKSGTTTETIANAELVIDALKKMLPAAHIDERVVVTSDEGSLLLENARKRGITALPIEPHAAGRYSVFSLAGVFPLLLSGLNVSELLRGACDMRDQCLAEFPHNPALTSAAILAKHYREGRRINDSFVFNGELESLGKWYRQLLGESLGKRYDQNGNEVFAGITPTVSVGSVDLHSTGQLYLGGPKDKLTTFIHAPHEAHSIPEKRFFPDAAPMISGKTTRNIMSAILEGTKTAYRKNGIPFTEIALSSLSEHELGAFLQFKMMEMKYLGKLLNVNVFDQPNVEEYKEETRRRLEGEAR